MERILGRTTELAYLRLEKLLRNICHCRLHVQTYVKLEKIIYIDARQICKQKEATPSQHFYIESLTLRSPLRMRRSFKIVRQQVKPKVVEEAIKKPLPEKDFSKWILKEVIMNPNFPRVIFLIIGAGSAISYYSRNDRNTRKNSSKRNEAIGDIKVERYSDRLSRYATSLELATNHVGTELHNRDNIAAVNAGFQLQNQLGMNFDDLTREQLLAIQAAQAKRNLAMKLHVYEKEQINRASRSKLSRSISKKEADVASENEKKIERNTGQFSN